MDRNDRIRASQAPREMSVVLLQQGHFRGERVGLGGFRTTPDWHQRAKGSGVALAAPVTQGRRVDPFAAEDRADIAGAGGLPQGACPSVRIRRLCVNEGSSTEPSQTGMVT